MTRKRRISEACNVRDPLNLNEVVTNDGPLSNMESLQREHGLNTTDVPHLPKDKFDSKAQNEPLVASKSCSAVLTSPRFIRPLVVRNPKDPLNLLAPPNESQKTSPIASSIPVLFILFK